MIDTLNITCPNCKTEFPLTQTLAQPFVNEERAKMQAEAQVHEAAPHKREQQLGEQRRKTAHARRALCLTGY